MATARQLEQAPNLYERDFLAWIEAQGQALKARQVAALDWDNLVEEIESMGRSQRNELKSRLPLSQPAVFEIPRILRTNPLPLLASASS